MITFKPSQHAHLLNPAGVQYLSIRLCRDFTVHTCMILRSIVPSMVSAYQRLSVVVVSPRKLALELHRRPHRSCMKRGQPSYTKSNGRERNENRMIKTYIGWRCCCVTFYGRGITCSIVLPYKREVTSHAANRSSIKHVQKENGYNEERERV
jgi:hypothetical protein